MTDETNPKDLLGLEKAPLRLIPGPSLVRLAKAMELGAKKYGAYNWRSKKVRHSIYLEAAMRHILSALDGEKLDRESGQPHEAHAMACMAIVLDADATGNLISDLPPPGVTADLIAATSKHKLGDPPPDPVRVEQLVPSREDRERAAAEQLDRLAASRPRS